MISEDLLMRLDKGEHFDLDSFKDDDLLNIIVFFFRNELFKVDVDSGLYFSSFNMDIASLRDSVVFTDGTSFKDWEKFIADFELKNINPEYKNISVCEKAKRLNDILADSLISNIFEKKPNLFKVNDIYQKLKFIDIQDFNDKKIESSAKNSYLIEIVDEVLFYTSKDVKKLLVAPLSRIMEGEIDKLKNIKKDNDYIFENRIFLKQLMRYGKIFSFEGEFAPKLETMYKNYKNRLTENIHKMDFLIQLIELKKGYMKGSKINKFIKDNTTDSILGDLVDGLYGVKVDRVEENLCNTKVFVNPYNFYFILELYKIKNNFVNNEKLSLLKKEMDEHLSNNNINIFAEDLSYSKIVSIFTERLVDFGKSMVKQDLSLYDYDLYHEENNELGINIILKKEAKEVDVKALDRLMKSLVISGTAKLYNKDDYPFVADMEYCVMSLSKSSKNMDLSKKVKRKF